MGRRFDLSQLAHDEVPDAEPRPARFAGVNDLAVADITTNPLHQRDADDEDPDELDRLAATITAHGVLQPLVVCAVAVFLEQFPRHREHLAGKRWVALIGNRRLVAARLAGVDRVRAIVDTSGLGSMYEVMLVENSHRKDLTPLREAEAMGRVVQTEGVSQRELAKRIGRTHTYVQQRLTLLDLVPELQAALRDGRLTVERARELGRLDQERQHAIAAAGPPFRETQGGNGVATRVRRPTLPVGDPQAAARSIRATYSGDQLEELIRLLTATRSSSSPA